nr:unnamed protein product [Spirometra erinaceieuropaei]
MRQCLDHQHSPDAIASIVNRSYNRSRKRRTFTMTGDSWTSSSVVKIATKTAQDQVTTLDLRRSNIDRPTASLLGEED